MFRRALSSLCSVRFALHRYWLSADAARQRELRTVPGPDYPGHDENAHQLQEISYLRSLLRSVPWWWEGHRHLADLAAETRDHELLFICSQALTLLARRDSERVTAARYLARYYLQRGAPERACELLIPFATNQEVSAEIYGELASALVGAERFEEALVQLDRIPEHARTVECEALRSYVRRKLESSSAH